MVPGTKTIRKYKRQIGDREKETRDTRSPGSASTKDGAHWRMAGLCLLSHSQGPTGIGWRDRNAPAAQNLAAKLFFPCVCAVYPQGDGDAKTLIERKVRASHDTLRLRGKLNYLHRMPGFLYSARAPGWPQKDDADTRTSRGNGLSMILSTLLRDTVPLGTAKHRHRKQLRRGPAPAFAGPGSRKGTSRRGAEGRTSSPARPVDGHDRGRWMRRWQGWQALFAHCSAGPSPPREPAFRLLPLGTLSVGGRDDLQRRCDAAGCRADPEIQQQQHPAGKQASSSPLLVLPMPVCHPARSTA